MPKTNNIGFKKQAPIGFKGVKVRIPCLKCGEKFLSIDKIRNRICNECNLANKYVTHRKCAVNTSDKYNIVYDDGGGA